MKKVAVLIVCFVVGYSLARLTTPVVVLSSDGTVCAEVK